MARNGSKRTLAGHWGDDSHAGLFNTNFISAVSANPTNWSSVFLCLSGGKALTKSLWKRMSEMPKPIRGRGFTTALFKHVMAHDHYFLYAWKHAASFELITGHILYLKSNGFWHGWLTKSRSRRSEFCAPNKPCCSAGFSPSARAIVHIGRRRVSGCICTSLCCLRISSRQLKNYIRAECNLNLMRCGSFLKQWTGHIIKCLVNLRRPLPPNSHSRSPSSRSVEAQGAYLRPRHKCKRLTTS